MKDNKTLSNFELKMNFIDYIKSEIKNHKPQKNTYGETLANHFYLEDLKFSSKTTVKKLKNLNIYYNKDKNLLDIDFTLLYKNHTFAVDVCLELYNPFQFEFIGNTEKTNDINFAKTKLQDYYDTIFKFEISADNLIIQAKNENLDLQLKTYFKKVNLDIVLVNFISFIDTLEKRPKHSNLFNTLCEIVTDKQLTSIANADYGWKAEKCFTDLKQIQQTQILPKEISFDLEEVLSLTRYGSNIKTNEEHQTLLFACTIFLLEKYDEQSDMLDNVKYIIAGMFASANKLGSFFIEQTQAFFLEILSKNTSSSEIQMYIYLIAGFDLLLKKEANFKNSFNYLQKIDILNNLNFEYETAYTAKRVKKASLLMLENLGFIKDKSLQKNAKQLFTTIIRICKERYDINAINTLFERTFTKEQQVEYINLMPELISVKYPDRYKFLSKKGLTVKQVQIITKSLSNASYFLEGSDHEMELKKNIFFNAYIALKKKE